MLDGDDYISFSLFSDLCKMLEVGGIVTCDESKTANEEHTRYGVEKRRQQSIADRMASDIPNVISFLLRDFRLQARRHFFRIFKLCCLVVALQRKMSPAVTIDLNCSAGAFDLCRRLVQTYVP